MTDVCAMLLCGGLGTRLQPLTDRWPKCLMPINGRPLLEYWLNMLWQNEIHEVLVNAHHFHKIIERFLERPRFCQWVRSVYEPKLLGTAGTLRKNIDFFSDSTILLIHADNWCQFNLNEFLNFHNNCRPAGTVLTMMTFRTDTPSTCGIVELDSSGVVKHFHEKKSDPPGDLANGAVYLVEFEVLTWIADHPEIIDFSTQVLPHYLGRISTWENTNIHRDIGTLESLARAQHDPIPDLYWEEDDTWQREFNNNAVHNYLGVNR